MSAYLLHLAQTNEIQKVSVKQDVLDRQGELILAKGEPVNHDNADLLLKHKLHAPIADLIELEEEFTANVIYEVFNEFIFSDPQYAQIYQLRDLNEKFVCCIEHVCQFKVLRQKLNVLAIQMPDVFEQGLFCAWIGATIFAFDNELQEKLNIMFMAGLTHDLGLLDVSPAILFKEQALNAREWEEMQEHPRIGAKFLRTLPGVSEEVVQAVYEHHENPDGTGYPKGKMAQQLGEYGRIVNMLDSVFAVYRKHFKPRNRSFNDMVPIVQMATLSRGGPPAAIMLSLMKKTPKTTHCTVPVELVPDLINWVKQLAQQIMDFIDETNKFRKAVGTQHKNLSLFALQNMARYIKSTLTSCGIINEAYMRWLDQVREEELEFAYRELEDVLLMTIEISHHIERFNRLALLYIKRDESATAIAKVKELQSKISATKVSPPPPQLAPYIYLPNA